MTVKELKDELNFYDDDMEVVFEFNDDVEVDTITESKWGWKEVHIDARLKPSFIGTCSGDMRIELEVEK